MNEKIKELQNGIYSVLDLIDEARAEGESIGGLLKELHELEAELEKVKKEVEGC